MPIESPIKCFLMSQRLLGWCRVRFYDLRWLCFCRWSFLFILFVGEDGGCRNISGRRRWLLEYSSEKMVDAGILAEEDDMLVVATKYSLYVLYQLKEWK